MMFMFKLDFQAVDILAIVLILCCFIMISLGRDSTVTAVLLAVSAYYFGHKRLSNTHSTSTL